MRHLNWSREQKLLRRSQFERCYASGGKHFTKNFILFVLLREDRPGGFRLGLTVSRKVGPAVARNRVKRVVREFFRLHQHEFELPIDVVFIPKKNLDPRKLTLSLATEELAPLMRKLCAEIRDESSRVRK